MLNRLLVTVSSISILFLRVSQKNIMSKAKNQHYVPQFYLKRFSHDKNQLFVFDKNQLISFPSSTRNIASGNYFYNTPQQAIDDIKREINNEYPNCPQETLSHITPQLVDNVLTELDAKYAKSIQNVIDTVQKKERITAKQKENLGIHIALQITRTREFRDNYIEFTHKLLTDISNAHLQICGIDAEAKVSPDPEHASTHHAQIMLNPNLLGTLKSFFVDSIWMFFINKTNNPLYTSDNPIVKYAHLASVLPLSTGWLSQGVEIIFPLNSNLLLSIQGRKLFHNSKSPILIDLANRMDGNLQNLQEKNVEFYNSLQVMQSYRQVYCKIDNFDLAKKICKENPQICDQDRDKWKRLQTVPSVTR